MSWSRNITAFVFITSCNMYSTVWASVFTSIQHQNRSVCNFHFQLPYADFESLILWLVLIRAGQLMTSLSYQLKGKREEKRKRRKKRRRKDCTCSCRTFFVVIDFVLVFLGEGGLMRMIYFFMFGLTPLCLSFLFVCSVLLITGQWTWC